jgi:hypothetical protein
MRSQWECLCQNVGQWQGEFIKISPAGEVRSAQPSETSLALLADGQTMHQTIRVGESVTNLQYRSLSRSVLFFEDGSFSQGSTQFTPVGEFGAELGLIDGNRRLRLVFMYQKGLLTEFTLIPERLPDADPIPPEPICGEEFLPDFLLNCTGKGEIRYPDGRTPELSQYEDIPDRGGAVFLPYQTIALCPSSISPRQSFSLELFWRLSPYTFGRMVRCYDGMGGWQDLRLYREVVYPKPS